MLQRTAIKHTYTRLLRACSLLAFSLLSSALLPGSVVADTHSLSYQALARHPQWLALLHMHKHRLTGHYRSEVDAPDFFLSGRDDDSEAELLATLRALNAPVPHSDNAWCRFPARAQFLLTHTALRPPQNLHCPALDYWRSSFTPEQIVMVYPDPYLKNIASIFGHTFLRIDALDQQQHPILLSQTISYYADIGATENNTLLYIAKGLTGHFPGIIALDPYFKELRTYSDNEDRDIHEYTLSIPPDKVKLFVDHVWEVRDSSFNYFFLDENCSYRLISMLDVVTPTHNLREQFAFRTIPIDTVRALKQHGLIASSRYIPSARKRFYEQLNTLSAAQKKMVRALADDPHLHNKAITADVLQAAIQYSDIKVQSDSGAATTQSIHTGALVQRLQQSGSASTAPALSAPDPLNTGHDMARLQTGWLRDDGKDYFLFGTRFAYHDMLDPLVTYQQGRQLDVLDFRFRVDINDEHSLSVDRIRWFGLQNYSPSDDFFNEASWGFAATLQRELVGKKTKLLNVFDGYRGLTRSCGALLCHAELTSSILVGGALDNNWDARAGIRSGAIYQSNNWTTAAQIGWEKILSGEGEYLFTQELSIGRTLARDTALYGSYRHESNDETQRETFTFTLRQFF